MSFADSFFRFANQISNDLAGDSIACHRPLDESATTIQATITPERVERRHEGDGFTLVTLQDLIVDESKLPGGVARIDMKWTIGDREYTTDSISDADGGFKCIAICRAQSRRPHREKYYRG